MKNLFFALLIIFLPSVGKAEFFGRFFVPKLEDSLKKSVRDNRSLLNAEGFNVLVWNIYKGKEEALFDEMPALLKQHELILIQEYVNREDLKDLIHSENHSTVFGASFGYKKTGLLTGSLIGIKNQVNQSAMTFERSVEREPFIKTPKTTTIAYLKMNNGETLLVANIHGLNIANFQKFKRQIEVTLNRIDQHRGPVLYAGDFNSRNDERIQYLQSQMRARGMNEAVFSPDERMVGGIGGKILDRVFVRGLKIIDAKSEARYTGSDHPPMILKLKSAKMNKSE